MPVQHRQAYASFDLTMYNEILKLNVQNPIECKVSWVHYKRIGVHAIRQHKKTPFACSQALFIELIKFPRWFASELTGLNCKTLTLQAKKYKLGRWGIVNEKRKHRMVQKIILDTSNLEIPTRVVEDILETVHDSNNLEFPTRAVEDILETVHDSNNLEIPTGAFEYMLENGDFFMPAPPIPDDCS